MTDLVIGVYPSGLFAIFTIEREAWLAKREIPGLRLYRYACLGEATKPAKKRRTTQAQPRTEKRGT